MLMNTQPIEKQEIREDGTLDVVACWHTIQGEGPHAGKPAIFVRLSACNLQCPACDTDYTTGRKLVESKQLYMDMCSQIPAGHSIPRLVVLTGGEPFRQNLEPFVRLLLVMGHQVQIETNGTLYLENFPYELVDIVCSPKTGSVNAKFTEHIDHYKYIIEAGKVDPIDGLPTDSLGAGVRVARPHVGFNGNIYVQPLDMQDPIENKKHADEAVRSCLKFGYTLSLQMHKLVGLD